MAGLAGPFREGADLFLSCQVSGGESETNRGKFVLQFSEWRRKKLGNLERTLIRQEEIVEFPD